MSGLDFKGAVAIDPRTGRPTVGPASLEEQRRFAAMQFACSQQCAASGPELVEKARAIEAYLIGDRRHPLV